MTRKNKIDIAIAKYLGWTEIQFYTPPTYWWQDVTKDQPFWRGIEPKSVGLYNTIPKYSSDLNLIHEVKKKLTPDQNRAFGLNLAFIITNKMNRGKPRNQDYYDKHARWIWNASALEHCQAFCQTLGIKI